MANFKDLKSNATKLNKSGLLDEKIKVVGISADDLETAFIEKIEEIDDAGELDSVPNAVYKFYETLVPDDDEEEDTDTDDDDSDDDEEDNGDDEEEDDECPSFGKGWKPKTDECKDCKTEHPNEYKQCKAATEKAKKKKGGKAKKETCGHTARTKSEKAKKKKAETTKYSHRPNTMSGVIDNKFIDGATLKSIVNTLMKKFDRTEDAALKKIKLHQKHLIEKHNVKFNVGIDSDTKKTEKIKIK